ARGRLVLRAPRRRDHARTDGARRRGTDRGAAQPRESRGRVELAALAHADAAHVEIARAHRPAAPYQSAGPVPTWVATPVAVSIVTMSRPSVNPISLPPAEAR